MWNVNQTLRIDNRSELDVFWHLHDEKGLLGMRLGQMVLAQSQWNKNTVFRHQPRLHFHVSYGKTQSETQQCSVSTNKCRDVS